MKKNKKEKFIDDGHTIYSMDGLSKDKNNNNTIYTDKSERRMMIKAAFKVYLPRLLLIIIGFTLAYILLWLWLM